MNCRTILMYGPRTNIEIEISSYADRNLRETFSYIAREKNGEVRGKQFQPQTSRKIKEKDGKKINGLIFWQGKLSKRDTGERLIKIVRDDEKETKRAYKARNKKKVIKEIAERRQARKNLRNKPVQFTLFPASLFAVFH